MNTEVINGQRVLCICPNHWQNGKESMETSECIQLAHIKGIISMLKYKLRLKIKKDKEVNKYHCHMTHRELSWGLWICGWGSLNGSFPCDRGWLERENLWNQPLSHAATVSGCSSHVAVKVSEERLWCQLPCVTVVQDLWPSYKPRINKKAAPFNKRGYMFLLFTVIT